jgi:serine/threonine protein kinase
VGPGTLLDGRFRIKERLGAGGMGVVWLARDQRLKRDVAVKVLSGSSDSDNQARELARRFEREAQVAAGLSSPHIVTVHDSGRTTVGGRAVLYLVMELLTGRPLNALLDDGSLRLPEVINWGRQICAGLAVAHARGVVHRDIKPGNIMVDDDGHVTLLDFGIARILEGTSTGPEITRSGAALGTVVYMSPEQASGARRVDERSDLYSLGCVLYAMVTGRPPFPSGPWHVVLEQHRSKPPEPPSQIREGLPPVWDDLILSLLAKDPKDRPQSAQEVGDRLSVLDTAAAQPSVTVPDRARPEVDEVPIAVVPTGNAETIPPDQANDGAAPATEPPKPKPVKPRGLTRVRKVVPARPKGFDKWLVQISGSLAVAVGVAKMGDMNWVGGRGASTLVLGLVAGGVSFFLFWPFARFSPEPSLDSEVPKILGTILGIVALVFIVVFAVSTFLADPTMNRGNVEEMDKWKWIVLFVVMAVPTGLSVVICIWIAIFGAGFAGLALEDKTYLDEATRVVLLGGWVIGMMAARQLILNTHNSNGFEVFLAYPAWICATLWAAVSMVFITYLTFASRTLFVFLRRRHGNS